MKAIAIRDGLKPSRVATGHFTAGPKRPVITTTQRTFEATLGKPFRAEFSAKHTDDALWFVGGKVGSQYREFKGQRFNPPKHIPWMSIDPATGVLTGTPTTAGVYPIIVSCMTKPVREGKRVNSLTGDALLVAVNVSK